VLRSASHDAHPDISLTARRIASADVFLRLDVEAVFAQIMTTVIADIAICWHVADIAFGRTLATELAQR
jgi:hypothetical protein